MRSSALFVLALSATVACSVIAQVDVTPSVHNNEESRPPSQLRTRNRRISDDRKLFGIGSGDAKKKFNKYLCTKFGINNCICNEAGLRDAIANNKNKNICLDTSITVSAEIDLSGKSFAIGCDYICDYALFECSVCRIEGAGSIRLLSGSPTSAKFSVSISKGYAENGGIAYLTGGTTTFGDELYGSKATQNGGAIYATGPSTKVELKSLAVYLYDNSANNGGAVYIADGATLSTENAHFYKNAATQNGGAIFATGSSTKVELVSSSLSENSANNGGAVYIADGTTLSTSALFFKNSAVNGGALAFEKGKADLSLARFGLGNTASGNGSNIWIADDASPALDGSNVNCDSTNKVLFCDSFEISEFAGGMLGAQLFNNTNCGAVGSVDYQACLY